MAAAAEIMGLPGDQVLCQAAAGIEVGNIFLRIGVNSHHDPLMFGLSLKDALFVGQDHTAEPAVIQGFGILFGLCQTADEIGQFVPFRLLHRGTKGGIAVLLVSFHPPLTAIIDAGNTGHAEDHSIDQGQMLLIIQDGGNPGHIMIVREGQQMPAGIKAPGIGSELAHQGMADLEHVHAVEAGVGPLSGNP